MNFLDYAAVAETACGTSQIEWVRKWKNVARKIINIFLCITQLGKDSFLYFYNFEKKILCTYLFAKNNNSISWIFLGFCCVYFVFISQNIQKVADQHFKDLVSNSMFYFHEKI